MKRALLLLLPLLAACDSGQDRLTDEQAAAEAVSGSGTNLQLPAEVSDAPAVATNEPGAILYKALGTEPGWALTVRENAMLYQGDYGTTRVMERTPRAFASGPGTYRSGSLTITIAGGPCSDGMSDHVWRDKVTVAVSGGSTAIGCGGGLVQVNAIEGDWTVTAVNGRPTGGGARFHISLRDRAVRAVFGCNGLQGAFTQNGDHLAISNLLGTQMRCGEPADSFERDAAAVLNSNMRVEQVGGRTRLVSEAGSIDLTPRHLEGPTT